MGERLKEGVRGLERTDFFSHGENPAQIERIRLELALSGALQAEKRHATRRFHRFSTISANPTDWLAERGGFEPPRPFRVYTLSRRAP